MGQVAHLGRHASEFNKGMTPRQEVPQPFNIVGVDGSVHQLGNQTVSWYGIECLADVHCSCQGSVRKNIYILLKAGWQHSSLPWPSE